MSVAKPIAAIALFSLGACASVPQQDVELQPGAPTLTVEAQAYKKLPAVPATPLAADVYLAALNAGALVDEATSEPTAQPISVTATLIEVAEPVPVQVAEAKVSVSPRLKPQMPTLQVAEVEAETEVLPPLMEAIEVAALATPMPANALVAAEIGVGGPEYSAEEFAELTGARPISRPERTASPLLVVPRARPVLAPKAEAPSLRRLSDAF